MINELGVVVFMWCLNEKLQCVIVELPFVINLLFHLTTGFITMLNHGTSLHTLTVSTVSASLHEGRVGFNPPSPSQSIYWDVTPKGPEGWKHLAVVLSSQTPKRCRLQLHSDGSFFLLKWNHFFLLSPPCCSGGKLQQSTDLMEPAGFLHQLLCHKHSNVWIH